jgi:hypothetical protein
MAGTSTADRVASFVEKIDRRLQKDARSNRTMKVTTGSKLRVILKDCGFEKRGSRNIARIEAALTERGIYTQPPLSTPGLDWEQVVYFSRTPSSPTERRLVFPVEHDLETFLVANWDYLFPDLKLVKRQFDVPSGIIDILAKDAAGYVVIELKTDKQDRRLVNQLADYISDVQEWSARKGKHVPVRGIALTAHRSPRMLDQLRAIGRERGCHIDWITYRMEMTLEQVPSEDEAADVARQAEASVTEAQKSDLRGRIDAYSNGEITFEDLTAWVRAHPPSGFASAGVSVTDPTFLAAVEEQVYPQPGTVQEFDAAEDEGVLSPDEVDALYVAAGARS